VARIGKVVNAYRILVKKSLRKDPLARWRRWEGNIKMGARLEIFMAMKIQGAVLWVMTLFSNMVGYQHLRP
jgi:hypothetical protein